MPLQRSYASHGISVIQSRIVNARRDDGSVPTPEVRGYTDIARRKDAVQEFVTGGGIQRCDQHGLDQLVYEKRFWSCSYPRALRSRRLHALQISPARVGAGANQTDATHTMDAV